MGVTDDEEIALLAFDPSRRQIERLDRVRMERMGGGGPSDADTRASVASTLRAMAADGRYAGCDGFNARLRTVIETIAGIPCERADGWPSLQLIERNDTAFLLGLADLIDPSGAQGRDGGA